MIVDPERLDNVEAIFIDHFRLLDWCLYETAYIKNPDANDLLAASVEQIQKERAEAGL